MKPAEFTYESVTTAPAEDIVALYQAGGWWRESRENRLRIEPMIRGSFCFMVVRAPDGKIVAMGRAISDGASDAYIQDVVVLPAYRRRGIGRELIRRLTRHCVEHEIEWIGLVAEPGTLAFYKDLGYSPLEGHQPMLYGKRG
ncbi:MAG TPA: GNAT family N-acetyltransferase [Acidobacteriota bacterium]|nr:GNAT family N-acetyltransferase [Acidobacteriota bacterium]